MEVKRIRKYYEQLYTNKLDNLDKMDTLLERYKLTQEIEILNIPITK